MLHPLASACFSRNNQLLSLVSSPSVNAAGPLTSFTTEGSKVGVVGVTKAFQKIKQLIASDLVLVHFNPELSLTLSCDASPHGLGAVLSHIVPNGVERPVAYASYTLTTAKLNYAQMTNKSWW